MAKERRQSPARAEGTQRAQSQRQPRGDRGQRKTPERRRGRRGGAGHARPPPSRALTCCLSVTGGGARDVDAGDPGAERRLVISVPQLARRRSAYHLRLTG